MADETTQDINFSFGLWTVGWTAQDQFGSASRPALDPAESVRRLADLGAWGFTFHDDDVVPFGADDAERTKRLDSVRQAAQLESLGRS